MSCDAASTKRGRPSTPSAAAPTQFGYVTQLAEVCPSTKRGALGFLLSVTITPGNPGENDLLPRTVSELIADRLRPRIVAVDGGFQTRPTRDSLEPIAPRRILIAGRAIPASRTTDRRLARFRTGCEGRISHLKRSYGLGRSRLRGLAGVNIHANWAILAHNLDTHRHYTTR